MQKEVQISNHNEKSRLDFQPRARLNSPHTNTNLVDFGSIEFDNQRSLVSKYHNTFRTRNKNLNALNSRWRWTSVDFPQIDDFSVAFPARTVVNPFTCLCKISKYLERKQNPNNKERSWCVVIFRTHRKIRIKQVCAWLSTRAVLFSAVVI